MAQDAQDVQAGPRPGREDGGEDENSYHAAVQPGRSLQGEHFRGQPNRWQRRRGRSFPATESQVKQAFVRYPDELEPERAQGPAWPRPRTQGPPGMPAQGFGPQVWALALGPLGL